MMKFNINGFSQEKLLEFKLDNDDSLILRWFIDFKDTGKMYSEIINEDKFYWLKYDRLIEDMPILKIKKDTLYRKLKYMAEIGILKRYTKKEKGTFSFYSVGHKYIELIGGYGKKSVGGTDLNPEGYGKKSDTKNYSTNNKSTINNNSTNKDLKDILQYEKPDKYYKNKNEAKNDIVKKCNITNNLEKYFIQYFLDVLEDVNINHYLMSVSQLKIIKDGLRFLSEIDIEISQAQHIISYYFSEQGYKTLYGMLEPKKLNYILCEIDILDSNNCYDEEGNIKDYFDV